MSKWSREEGRIKRTFSAGTLGFFKIVSANLKIINKWLDYKNKQEWVGRLRTGMRFKEGEKKKRNNPKMTFQELQ